MSGVEGKIRVTLDLFNNKTLADIEAFHKRAFDLGMPPDQTVTLIDHRYLVASKPIEP